MSKWKTTQRRSNKPATIESGGNEPSSDGSSLSFLDDMLASRTSRPAATRQEARRDVRTPPPRQQMNIGYVDDIIDLASVPDERRRPRRRGSNSSGSSANSNHNNREGREPVRPTVPYAPVSARSSLRPLMRYGSAGATREHEHSQDPLTFPSGSEHTLYRSGRSAPQSWDNVGRRNLTVRASTQDPLPRPNSNVTSLRSEGHRALYSDHEDDADEDYVMPIPVFQVYTDDQDTISCITTSVSSHYDMDTRSGSHPWSQRNSYKSAPSLGERSNADTLDELADMLHPNQNGRSNALTPRAGIKSRSPNVTSDYFRPPPPAMLTPVDDVFGTHPHCTQIDDAPPLNAEEIYRGTKASKRLSQRHSWMSYGEPFLSQTRLLFRYWISLVLPRHWRKKGGKDDDGQGYLGTWDSSVNPNLGAPSKQRRLCSLSGLLLIMMMAIVLVPFVIQHGPQIKSTAMGRIRAATKKRMVKQPIGKDVHGGMSKRNDVSSVVEHHSSIVAGGMAPRGVHVAEAEAEAGKNDYSHTDHFEIQLPVVFDVLADVTDLPVRKGVDAPFYWHIPRSGGGTVNDVFGGCLSLTLASDAGSVSIAGHENKLEIIKFSKRFSYVNVDTATPAGIARAKRLDLIGSGLADITVSSLLYQAMTLFSERHKGRLFTLFRHPVERSVSLFHYLQDTQWRRDQSFRKELSELTIDEYFESGFAENNWMTRFLINEPTKGELTKEDFLLAKEILRRKCLVGLMKEKGESFARFERYFGYPLKNDEQKDCHEKKLHLAWAQKHRHDEVEENTPTWDLIVSRNVYDMELYNYVSEVLFVEQAEIFK